MPLIEPTNFEEPDLDQSRRERSHEHLQKKQNLFRRHVARLAFADFLDKKHLYNEISKLGTVDHSKNSKGNNNG